MRYNWPEPRQGLFDICEIMRKYASVQLLEMNLTFDIASLAQALASDGQIDWMQAIRSIGVKEFRLTGCSLDYHHFSLYSQLDPFLARLGLRGGPNHSAANMEVFRASLPKLIEPMLRATAFRSHELTAEERYLSQSRADESIHTSLITDQPWSND